MTRTAEVPFRDHVFHVLRAAARPGLRLLPGPLPLSVDFRYEAVDDSRDPFRRAVKPYCRGGALCVDRAGERLAPATARDGESRRPRPVTDRFRFRPRPARTRVAVCGSVRIPVPPAAKRANRPARSPLPGGPSRRSVPEPFPTRLSRTRVGVCGSVRIVAEVVAAVAGVRAGPVTAAAIRQTRVPPRARGAAPPAR